MLKVPKKEMITIFFLPIYTHQLQHHTEGHMHLLMDMRTRARDSAGCKKNYCRPCLTYNVN